MRRRTGMPNDQNSVRARCADLEITVRLHRAPPDHATRCRIGYDDRFLRLWTYYLAYCEAAFAIRALRDVQLVLSRPFDDTLPSYPEERLTY